MIRPYNPPDSDVPRSHSPGDGRASPNASTLLAVVASVNDDALKAWAALWEQLSAGVSPAGWVLPQMQHGFKPSCGWTEFLESFWVLKHDLDYLRRYCRTAAPAGGADPGKSRDPRCPA
jgi:hypothetical protein